MHPILARFAIGDWELVLPAYGTCLVLAAIVAGSLAVRGAMAPAVGLSRRRAGFLYAVTVIAGVCGARLLDVALDWGAYAPDPGRIMSPSPHGFALAGGFAVGVTVAVLLARRWAIDPGSLADSAVVPIVAGIVLMRIGCFLNGCCAGEVTSLPWGVTFPYGSSAWGEQVLSGDGGLLAIAGQVQPVHPTQLYEAAGAVVCGLLALLAGRRLVPPGTAALVFVSAFLALRTFNQVLRPDPPGATLSHEMLVAAYAVAAMVAAGCLAGWLARRARVAIAL